MKDEYAPSAGENIIKQAVTQREIHDLAKYHGFWSEPVNYGEKIALIHSECTELLEVIRDPLEDTYQARAEELADIAIRVMDLAEYWRIHLEEAIRRKHKKNKSRPFRHGKRF